MSESGIPTVYAGRQYRSRLEARWASFFDLAGWPFEYEPFDLAGWIPDFLLLGETRVLVEVKPVVDFPKDVAHEITVAAHRFGWPGELLIVGSSLWKHVSWLSRAKDDIQFGWTCDGVLYFPEHLNDREKVCGYWFDACSFGTKDVADYCSDSLLWIGRVFGQTVPSGWDSGAASVFRRLWTQAGNLTQWHGRQSVTS